MRFIVYALGVVFAFYANPIKAQKVVEVQNLDMSKIEQRISIPIKNKSVIGEPISIDGKPYAKGIGVLSNSVITIKLNSAQRFSAEIGVADNLIHYGGDNEKGTNPIKSIPLTNGKRIFYKVAHGHKQFLGVEGKAGTVDRGSVVFRVLHNGKEIYNSGLMTQGDPLKQIDVKAKGGLLQLIVDDAKDGSSGDHAVWVNPKVTYRSKSPIIIASDVLADTYEQPKEIEQKLTKKIEQLPSISAPLATPSYDWLLDNSQVKAQVYRSENGKDIIISNQLIARRFRLMPNLATIDYTNQMTGESLLRAVSNEGVLTIDGKSYSLGGLSGQVEYGYTLMKWVDQMTALSTAFQVTDFEVKPLSARMKWKQVRWASNKSMPRGKEIIFTLVKDQIVVKIHFALYDGIPTLSKWIEVINRGKLPIRLNHFKVEQLAMVPGEDLVDIPEHWIKPNIHVETDYAFGGMNQKTSNHTVFWEKDLRYTSQTNYPMAVPCILEVKSPLGPDTDIPSQDTLTTFRVWEMPLDTRERERQGLFIRKMYRTISPWTTENPIFLHLISTNEEKVKRAVDQCAAVGYEMIILSFGSGLNMENESAKNYKKFKALREYANSKGVELGGYSLLSSRWISDEVDVINPKTGKRGGMIFGSSPCLSSEWGYDYFRKMKKFYQETGMQVFENDGSYPGNVCASTTHKHHHGLNDSQWKQYAQIQNLYRWMRAEGIYMNIPDFYFNAGSNKTGIGYREVNWSLPRERQLVIGRMNIYDGLWERIPSMCWTFVPLTQYHGGGAAATLEPLNDHLDDYENHMMQNYGSGVQACYRGPRLYDTSKTKALVKEVITWYKKYRDILNSDLIHLKRASGKDWDGFLHVNPDLKEKGLAMFFNPTDKDIKRNIKLPLYYTGLDQKASVRIKDGKKRVYEITKDGSITIKVNIAAHSYQWIVIE
ncbi:NPCBM/NEW2 domain-containing protein [Halosquirtibacter xylanolyticus]|uniref:NPCBM/NEW2 domain-containing protein n=1 Tax=Halosquirtibacter xylanolyticus TaxID=3374599 RepID=UPI00374809CC|nr:NPCBM/NEW2 domain-containing protein [Prolixibacteraceae bacterium]